MKKPRFIERIRAFYGGYFWLPCPVCGKMFGGHELRNSGYLIIGRRHMGVCNDCPELAAKINERNYGPNWRDVDPDPGSPPPTYPQGGYNVWSKGVK